MPCEAHSFFWVWLDTFGTDQDTFKQHSRPTNYYHRQRLMVFNVTITIGAIISSHSLGSIIFRWFSDKNNRWRRFLMVVNNGSSDAIIPMHRLSLAHNIPNINSTLHWGDLLLCKERRCSKVKTLNGTEKLHAVIWAVAAEAELKYEPQIFAINIKI